MSRYRTQGILAAGLGLLIAGCFTDPDLKTGLRPEGPPEVLTVLAFDISSHAEAATFCKYDAGGNLDEKAPNLVQGTIICPKLEADFEAAALEPLGCGIRVVFDELLNGDVVERLDCDVTGPDGVPDGIQDDPITICTGHIDTTHPVTLMCEGVPGELAYDGYYVPNGNRDSFPVGPSILVEPPKNGDGDYEPFPAPTGSTCTITIGTVVVDKSGEGVASGPDSSMFTMQVADLALIETDPVDAADVADRAVLEPDGEVAFIFNANIDDASIAVTEVVLTTEAGVPVPVDIAVDGNVVIITGVAPLAPGNYTAKITATSTILEVNGGSTTFANEVVVRFVVAAP